MIRTAAKTNKNIAHYIWTYLLNAGNDIVSCVFLFSKKGKNMKTLKRMSKVFLLIFASVLFLITGQAYAGNMEHADICCKNTDGACITKYASVDLNIRKSPSTEGEIISMFHAGDKVSCTETVEDGWRKISFEGKYAFVSGKYLEDRDPARKNTYRSKMIRTGSVSGELSQIYDHYGSEGRLIIPSVGINVAVEHGSVIEAEGNNAQSICNMQDTAVWFTPYRHYSERGTTDCIADHKNQGFNGLYDVEVGDKAYLLRPDGSYSTLTCIRTCPNGHNTEVDLTDDAEQSCCFSDCDLFMYTCNPEGWWDITVTYWNFH